MWDLVPQTESIFLGECTVDIQKAFLDDRAVWYRLEDTKNLRAQTLQRCSNASNCNSNLTSQKQIEIEIYSLQLHTICPQEEVQLC